jgi:hypothetical protein
MANVNVAEFSALGFGGVGQAAQEPPINVQNVAIGATSVQSGAFQPGTRMIRIATDAIAWIAFGNNPVAVAVGAGTIRMAANTAEYFCVATTSGPSGPTGDKIAVITGT